jgi:superkiller protein 3
LLSGLGYSALLFAPSVTSAFALDTSLLHQPSFALARYCDETPHDTSALLLHALILERLGLTEAAMNRVQDAAFLLEARYEKSESAETEKQYIVALVNLGRLQLSQGENENAASTMTDCIGLCSDRTDDEGIAILAQCHLVLAISLSNQESVDEALEEFQKSLGAAERLSVPSRRDICKERISVLLARTLWHFGVEDARDAAKNNLLEA